MRSVAPITAGVGIDSWWSEVMQVGSASGCDDVLSAARNDCESVVGLTRDLVAIPSRGGVDSYQPVLDRLAAWLQDRDLPVTVLSDADGALVGLTSEIRGARPGPRWVLDACLDTAPFGDERPGHTRQPRPSSKTAGCGAGAAPIPSPVPRSSATSPPA
jgi:hypothetical protein